jgi:hypothetical protein
MDEHKARTRDQERAVEGIERAIQRMKEEPLIYLESTWHYVMPDPEDAESVYDTCDTLGPWHTLEIREKETALNEFDWHGVHPDDKRQIFERETTLDVGQLEGAMMPPPSMEKPSFKQSLAAQAPPAPAAPAAAKEQDKAIEP